jgi:hypothetical protein
MIVTFAWPHGVFGCNQQRRRPVGDLTCQGSSDASAGSQWL